MARLRVPVSNADHSQGPKNAPLVLVEYGDYECPHCGRAYPIVKQVQQTLGNELLFVFRNFPLAEIHPHAMNAARAAEAAGRQGRFWEMHDLLFENQDRLDDQSLQAYASSLELDLDKFVEAYARRIASFDKKALVTAKRMVNARKATPSQAGLADSFNAIAQAIAWPEAHARIGLMRSKGWGKPGEVELNHPRHVGLLGAELKRSSPTAGPASHPGSETKK